METNITHQNIGDEAHALFQSIKQLVDQSRQTVVVSINTALCRLNYGIGQHLVQALGFRPYDSYGQSILATLSQTLSWSHFVELATIEDATKRLYYQQLSVHNHWSVRELRKRQDAMDYERSLIAAKPEDKIVIALTTDNPMSNPDVTLKNSYILDFLGLHGYYSEKDLEDAIVSQLERFILELGQGLHFWNAKNVLA